MTTKTRIADIATDYIVELTRTGTLTLDAAREQVIAMTDKEVRTFFGADLTPAQMKGAKTTNLRQALWAAIERVAEWNADVVLEALPATGVEHFVEVVKTGEGADTETVVQLTDQLATKRAEKAKPKSSAARAAAAGFHGEIDPPAKGSPQLTGPDKPTQKEINAAQGTQDLLAGKYGSKIVRVTELGKKGQPTRVDIRCGLVGCKATRNIAVQDLFQVRFCGAEHKKLAAKGQKAVKKAKTA